jgi:ABC-type phosphate/phosphonate transport system substrate-binding protein
LDSFVQELFVKLRLLIFPVICVLLVVFIMQVMFDDPADSPSPNTANTERSTGPVYIAVMDPLALENACACVEGFAQRDYKALADYLKAKLDRNVEVTFCESIENAFEQIGHLPDILIGKKSVIEFDGKKTNTSLVHIAMLTGKDGKTTLTGLFVALSDCKIEKISDLKGLKIAFGPEDSDEKHSAALSALKEYDIEKPSDILTCGTCSISVMEVINGQADAAVISSYALPLLIGCQTVGNGELKVIGKTAEVPFVAVYTTQQVNPFDAESIQQVLLDACQDKSLMIKLESMHGFVRPGQDISEKNGWTDWGGKDRSNQSVYVPETLTEKPVFLWEQKLTSQSLGGIAATDKYVIVSDKNDDLTKDIWRCLDPETGNEKWNISYPAPGEMDYTNSPRATPVINNGRAYLLGAFGDIHCVEISSGETIWKLNFIDHFGGEVPTWGFCGTPLVVDNKIIVSTGAPEAALVALDSQSGDVIWKTAGNLPGYGNLIVGTFGGKRQIVGHDAITIGGWDIDTGKRLWTVTPPEENDFNVPTPAKVGDKLLVASENNGTRLYAFNNNGTIQQQPIAVNDDLRPDIASPILADSMIWGICYDGLFCLDPANGLQTVWTTDQDPFNDYASLITGNGRVLVVLIDGSIAIVPSKPAKDIAPKTLTVLKSKNDFDVEVWSQPALLDSRLYIRNEDRIVCLLLTTPNS